MRLLSRSRDSTVRSMLRTAGATGRVSSKCRRACVSGGRPSSRAGDRWVGLRRTSRYPPRLFRL
ncbi:hypothetical protein SGR_366 [Streptomyces griseus subsp. griseus NBRC 13350]|uniref:Uncharacterized protein n=1 Tax=Streptomyces griseus subsp. griseus (strain JCM 4626 / CBS 651.72 / NBRC 13350 / KCC S-0626 / ISP 5235) TaxID=455632 RepID=B1VQ94_STRGG|nr:hypothetical protein SGR_366 [Streptomyces griseus subsp. griseus NBRC 13350]